MVPSITDDRLIPLFVEAQTLLSNRDFSSSWHFVACFSENEDDLGQWRGYGGGECGYAIGFDFDRLRAKVESRRSTCMVPLQYKPEIQSAFVSALLGKIQSRYLLGIERGFEDRNEWAKVLVSVFGYEADKFASMTKNKSFKAEREHRIVTSKLEDEELKLEFRQKHTLLARHLPLDLTVTADDGNAKLPLTRIVVGPSYAQKVSRISVGDLLVKHGYKGVPVELSKVPFRIPLRPLLRIPYILFRLVRDEVDAVKNECVDRRSGVLC